MHFIHCKSHILYKIVISIANIPNHIIFIQSCSFFNSCQVPPIMVKENLVEEIEVK